MLRLASERLLHCSRGGQGSSCICCQVPATHERLGACSLRVCASKVIRTPKCSQAPWYGVNGLPSSM